MFLDRLLVVTKPLRAHLTMHLIIITRFMTLRDGRSCMQTLASIGMYVMKSISDITDIDV